MKPAGCAWSAAAQVRRQANLQVCICRISESSESLARRKRESTRGEDIQDPASGGENVSARVSGPLNAGGMATEQLELPFVDSMAIAAGRSGSLGPDGRPVAVPDDVDDPRHDKASGRVELAIWIRWSGDPVTYDLDDPVQRSRAYEQILREGNVEDIRRYLEWRVTQLARRR